MSLRLFAALPVPEDIGETLKPLMKGVPGARWRPRENFHITLRFFGEMDERQAEDLDAELAAIQAPAFTLGLEGAGWFGKADPHALWLGLSDTGPVTALNAKCDKAARRAGLAPDPRKFHPHMTLAYLQGTPMDRLERFIKRCEGLETEAWPVTHFTLYASWTHRGEANIYEALADYPLG